MYEYQLSWVVLVISSTARRAWRTHLLIGLSRSWINLLVTSLLTWSSEIDPENRSTIVPKSDLRSRPSNFEIGFSKRAISSIRQISSLFFLRGYICLWCGDFNCWLSRYSARRWNHGLIERRLRSCHTPVVGLHRSRLLFYSHWDPEIMYCLFYFSIVIPQGQNVRWARWSYGAIDQHWTHSLVQPRHSPSRAQLALLLHLGFHIPDSCLLRCYWSVRDRNWQGDQSDALCYSPSPKTRVPGSAVSRIKGACVGRKLILSMNFCCSESSSKLLPASTYPTSSSIMSTDGHFGFARIKSFLALVQGRISLRLFWY